MSQPEGFVEPGKEKKVCKLVKSLYGLKQTPKQWHEKFDQIVLSYGFKSIIMINLCMWNNLMILDVSFYVCIWMTY